MNILFWLSKSKADRRGLCPIYTRITINGKRAEFSTGIKLHQRDWDKKKNRVRGSSEFAIISNRKLVEIETNLKKTLMYRELQDLPITSKIIKDLYLNPVNITTALALADELVQHKAQLVEVGKAAKRTYNTWKNARMHLHHFLTKTKQTQLTIEQINIDLADNFFHYLKVEANLAHNTAVKYARILKSIIKKAIAKDLISVNRLELWTLNTEKKPESQYIFLNDKELAQLESHPFTSEALQKIADLYIFQSYTGFSYVELKSFDFESDTYPYQGSIYISKYRQKTGNLSLIPIFPKALEILKKYGMQLPKPAGKIKIISNTKYNKRLKEIAEILGIKKNLTTHTARVTAGMKWLNSGVGLDEVARMLGDNPETVRRHYAYILPDTINTAITDVTNHKANL